LVRKIRFINIHLISKETYLKAEELTSDVDIDDCEFIALTEHLNGKLWSGDKKLIKGLLNKKWKRFINSGELYEISLTNK
jgi:predicted nucleic acid-binding protein